MSIPPNLPSRGDDLVGRRTVVILGLILVAVALPLVAMTVRRFGEIFSGADRRWCGAAHSCMQGTLKQLRIRSAKAGIFSFW
jgi:hypothetical protein